MKKIPIKQETVEICEVFGLNPYELISGGALLMVTPDGGALVGKFHEAGIPEKILADYEETCIRIPILPD